MVFFFDRLDLTLIFSSLVFVFPRKLSLGNNMIASFAGAKFLGSIRELGLHNVNKNGVTSLAGVTFDLQLGDPDWVCSGLVPDSECALPGNGSLIAGYG